MAKDIRNDDPANSDVTLSERLIRECRVEEENALYTSTTFYIWLRFLRLVRAGLWITATLSGGLAASQVLKNDPAYRMLIAVAALAGVLLPAMIRALRLDNTIQTYSRAAASFKALQGDFRRAAEVWSAKSEPEFEQEVRKILKVASKVRALSLTPPEFCFRLAQRKIKKGDYKSDVH